MPCSAWGHDPRFVFVAGNLYQLPLATGVLDSLVMVRVMHHLADVPAALAQLRARLAQRQYGCDRVCQQAQSQGAGALGGTPPGIGRRLTRSRSSLSELNFDFHPAWMDRAAGEAGFVGAAAVCRVSHFRTGALKRTACRQPTWRRPTTRSLASVGATRWRPASLCRRTLAGCADPAAASTLPDEVAHLFACPACGHEGMLRS